MVDNFQRALERFDLEGFMYKHCSNLNPSGDELEATCVFCSSHEMSMNLDKGLGQCWKCGARFNTTQLVARILNISVPAARTMIQKDTMVLVERDLDSFKGSRTKYSEPAFEELKPTLLPRNFVPLSMGDLFGRRAWRFLINRGFTQVTLEPYGFGCSFEYKYRNMVIIPITYKGKQVMFTARSVLGPKKYSNPIEQDGYYSKKTVLFGYDQVDTALGFICIGEGPFDALSLPNGISGLGKRLSDIQVKLIRELGVSTVYICLDGGEHKEAIRLAELLVEHFEVYEVFFPEGTDPNDHIQEIYSFLEGAEPYVGRLSQF